MGGGGMMGGMGGGGMMGGRMKFNLLGASPNFGMAVESYTRLLRTDLRQVPMGTPGIRQPTVSLLSDREREPASPSVPLPRFNGQRQNLRGGRSPN